MSAQVVTLTSLFKSDQYLREFLKQAQQQSLWGNYVLYFRLNNPSPMELDTIGTFSAQFPQQVIYSVAQSRESLGESWNYMLSQTNAKYVAIWNVDDSRSPNSLADQWEVLERDPTAGVSYGAFRVQTSGGRHGVKIMEQSARSSDEMKSGMHLGPFFMWRGDLVRDVGLFDEQLISATDYDYAIRLASHTKVAHTNSVLGSFLNAGRGLSTRKGSTQPIERTVVEVRYGLLHKVQSRYLKAACLYRFHHALYGSEWHPMEAIVPDYWTSREAMINQHSTDGEVDRREFWYRLLDKMSDTVRKRQ